MTSESTTTVLRFTGSWSTLSVLGVALGLAGIMYLFYRRELRHQEGAARWVPALLRSLAIFFLVLCLLEPILEHSTTFRQLGRVVIAADASASMSYTDDLERTGATSQPANSSPAKQSPMAGEARFRRVERALLDPISGIVKQIASRHDVELFLLRGSKAERVWWQRDEGRDVSGDLPQNFGIKPDATITNLDKPLQDALGPSPAGTALVVLSDGQHNAAGSPEALASALHESGIPVFTVGYGSEVPPPDLALVNVIAPEAVFNEDRAEGVIVVQDSLPAGLPAIASISYLNKPLWQQSFTTTGGGERHFEFAFSVHELANAPAVSHSLRLLSFKAELTGANASKDRIPENNQRTVALHLLTRKRKALILDGTARWETRYLKNYLELDQRWQVSTAFDDFSNGANSAIQAVFPKKKEDLMGYDLLVLGDLRPEALSPEQQEMIAEFVEKRGGGLILVDGRHHHLPQWSQGKAGALLPVSWPANGPDRNLTGPFHYALTEQGLGEEALHLSDSSSANPLLWKQMPPAEWCAHAEPLTGSVVLVNVTEADKKYPVCIWRRVGAGSVFWLGTDELWRWRFEVADLYHQRFWKQVGSWIAAPPFLVDTPRISIGTDRLRYQEGDTAELRVRVRDEKGAIIATAKPRAHVFRNGLEMATLDLDPDPNHGGVFRATTGQLPPGDYQIGVTESNSAQPDDPKLPFRVESQANQEWGQLAMNRPLLEAMAHNSGGRFFREGDISQLPDILQSLDRKETRFSETNLWSSWWMLGTVIVLLTVEWLLRKKWRLV